MIHQDQGDAFAMEPEDQIVLSVLTGSQQGAQMALRPVTYVVGSGDDADIVLADGELERRHASLSVSAEGVTLEALEGALTLGDEEIKPGRTVRLEVPCALGIGLIAIGIGLKATDWSEIPLPRRAARKNDGAAEAAVDAETPAERQAGAPIDGAQEEGVDATDATDNDALEGAPPPEPEVSERESAAPETRSALVAEAPAPTLSEPAKPARRSRRRWVIVCSGLVAAALIAAAVVFIPTSKLWTFGTGGAGDPPPNAADDTIGKVEKIVESTGLDNLSVTNVRNVGIVISGTVGTESEYAKLASAMRTAGVGYVDRIRVVEQIQKALQISLSGASWPEPNFEDHLEVRHESGSQFVIDGFLGPEVDRSELRRHLEGDVPAVTNLRFTRSDLSFWQKELDQRIEKAGLSDWLKTSLDGSDIRVDGELTAPQAKTWAAVGESFVSDSRGFPRISIGVTAPAAPQPSPSPAPDPKPAAVARPDITLVGVVLSDDGEKVALLGDGSTVRQGDTLESGAVVDEITFDWVVIKGGDTKFVYRIK